MNKIQVSIYCLALFTTASFSSTKATQIKLLAQPNIILILADDQGWGATSVPMSEGLKESASDFIKTPNLERLAASAMVFSNGYASHPNCSPTRASIQTGKTPALLQMTDIIDRNSGVFYEGNKLTPPQHINGLPYEEITIAELIKTKRPEYSTAHFGKWHLGNGGPEKHGYDISDGSTKNAEGDTKVDDNPKDIYGITNRSIAWMQEQVSKDKPFFVQLSHYATHLAIETKKSTVEKINQRTPGKRHQSVELAGMAEDLDEGIGMILDEVDKLNISDNTYIIYLADNGTYPTKDLENINGPIHGWKATVWEGGIRVPFMISGPGIKHQYSTSNVVSHDLYPTIAQWLNIQDLPAGIEGASLVSELKAAKGKDNISRKHDFFVFHFPHYQLNKGTQPASAIIKGDYKLIRLYEDEQYLLFNLKDDLDEMDNLAKRFPEKLNELKAELVSYLSSIDAAMPTQNTDYVAEKDPGINYITVKERILIEPYFVVD
ncbi:MAG: sulfatase [Colwellia sp.]|nr:sulfatase [Colwellia sp.]